MLNKQISLAASVGVTLTVLTTLFQFTALADPIQSGTYYNTPGSKTTFNNGSQTGSAPQNSGTVHFTAPENVTRINGNMEVASHSSTPPINSVNNGAIAQGGTYFNTADSKTTFTNTSGGGIWLQSGSNLRGLEVDALGKLTNNGGTIHFYAPGAVVRLDGNIDVRAVRAGSEGSYLGNGGKLFVDSSFLYQNGNIYANGINGGLVQFNVGAATFGENSRIEAKGFEGAGGVIAINASGPVNVGRQTVLDSSGKVAGSIDTNLINIEGGLVNVAGNLFANGIESRGGTIRIVATGQSDLSQTSTALAQAVTAGNFTEGEKNNIEAGLLALKNAHDGDIVIAPASGEQGQANVYANGYSGAALTSGLFPEPTSGNDPTDPTERAGDGGTIMLTAQRNIENGGWVLANGGKGNPYVVDMSNPNSFTSGGHGGMVSLIAGNNITNTGRIVTDGGFGGISVDTDALHGGNGGLMAFSYGNLMNNTGVIRGHGGAGAMKPAVPTQYGRNGAGGLAVFSGTQNLSGNGLVSVLGAPSQDPESPAGKLGTIVAPDPWTSTNTLIGHWDRTNPIEMLIHAENLLLLRTALDESKVQYSTLTGISIDSQIRSISDPLGQGPNEHGGLAETEFLSKIAAPGDTLEGNYYFRNFLFSNQSASRHGHQFLDPIRLTRGLVTEIATQPFNTMTIHSTRSIDFGFPTYSPDPLSYTPKDIVLGQPGSLGGGRFSLISAYLQQNLAIKVNGGLGGGSINIATTRQNAYPTSASGLLISQADITTGGPLHGGSLIMKSDGYLRAASYIYKIQSNGDSMGGVQQFISSDSFGNTSSIEANGGLSGGSIFIKAANQIRNNGYPDRPYHLQANGGDYGGRIELEGAHIVNQDWENSFIEAKGGIEDGQVIQQTIP